jgi:hypothetical protein
MKRIRRLWNSFEKHWQVAMLGRKVRLLNRNQLEGTEEKCLFDVVQGAVRGWCLHQLELFGIQKVRSGCPVDKGQEEVSSHGRLF